MLRFLSSLLLLSLMSCGGSKPSVEENGQPVPVITFDEQTIDIGVIKRGEKRDIEFKFTNTGHADLQIELITACKCTSMDWPRGVIPPGGRGKLSATFDSKDQRRGELKKTIDIIANTDPIVAECFFTAIIE